MDTAVQTVPVELLTVADDEAVIWQGPVAHRHTDLPPEADLELEGPPGVTVPVRTLPRRGELLCRIATVNDVHFGETAAGVVGGDHSSAFSVPEGAEPYPEVMNRGAVAEIDAAGVDLVVAKGDLTSEGRPEEYQRFLEVYGGAFGERLLHVRGNHESYNRLDAAAWPTQERRLDGVTVALLDTSRDGEVGGTLDADQLEWLDELGRTADQPVLVFGHHPVWDPAEKPRGAAGFDLSPESTEALQEVFHRRHALKGWFAGHDHRNAVVRDPARPEVPYGQVACVKDFPGSWAEYRIHDGLITQVHRRISTPEAIEWTERTRGMFDGLYPLYVLGPDPLDPSDHSYVVWDAAR